MLLSNIFMDPGDGLLGWRGGGHLYTREIPKDIHGATGEGGEGFNRAFAQVYTGATGAKPNMQNREFANVSSRGLQLKY